MVEYQDYEEKAGVQYESYTSSRTFSPQQREKEEKKFGSLERSAFELLIPLPCLRVPSSTQPVRMLWVFRAAGGADKHLNCVCVVDIEEISVSNIAKVVTATSVRAPSVWAEASVVILYFRCAFNRISSSQSRVNARSLALIPLVDKLLNKHLFCSPRKFWRRRSKKKSAKRPRRPPKGNRNKLRRMKREN